MRTASKEQRAKAGDPRKIEYRAATEAPVVDEFEGEVSGYLTTWWVVDSFGTAFAPTAFDKTLSERRERLPLLYQHNPDFAIGRLTNIESDDIGLKHSSTVIDDGAEGTVLRKRLEGGVPFGHSHGFRTIQERSATDADPLIFSDNTPNWVRNNPNEVYVITEVKAYEGSIVTFPSNDLAIITGVRSNLELETLSTTLEALRAGTLTDAQRALLAEIAAAWEAAPELHPQPPRTLEQARADREFALNLELAHIGLSVEDILSAV